jgi:hypothetical protein
MKRSPRQPFILSPALQQRLNSYALAASAAGVGVLAVTQPAAAKIIYTAAHAVITRNHAIALDLNHDGKKDFTFQETFITTTSVDEDHSLILSVLPARQKNEIWGKAQQASALRAGVQVGPKGKFSVSKKTMAVDYYADGTGGSGTCAGQWNNLKNRYLGLKFIINGTTHFGWARLNVTCTTTYENHEVTGVLTGYAYETTPNKPIITGKTQDPDDDDQPAPASLKIHTSEPATLGALALGAPGLAVWKREESVSRAPDGT